MDYRSLAFDYSGVDMGHAVSMFNKACDWGDERSCVQLGYIYENGTDVPQDMEKAKQYFSKSCSMATNRRVTSSSGCGSTPQFEQFICERQLFLEERRKCNDSYGICR